MFDTLECMAGAGELIDTIRDAAGELAGLDLRSVPLQELGGLLQQVESARAVVDAAASAVLDRFDAEGASSYDGLRSTTSWLRQHCQMTGATAARRVRTARALRQLPEVADRFRTGRFSADQADLFARNLTPRTAEAMAEDEALLAGLAEQMRPDDLARELRGWAELVDTDGAEPDPGHRGRAFTFVQTLDDTWTGRLDLSAADGLFLNSAVDAMAEALYRAHEAGRSTSVGSNAPRPDDSPDPAGADGAGGVQFSPPGPPLRTTAQRRADALLELVRLGTSRSGSVGHAVTVPDAVTDAAATTDAAAMAEAAATSGAAGSGPHREFAAPDRPTIPRVMLHLTLDAADLEGGRGADSLDGHHLGAAATDRLLCDAALSRVLTDPFSGAVLDFDRRRRLVSPAQRTALALRDGGCSFPGCTAPPQDCDAHHIVHWRRGGLTNLDNLALCCWGTHHQLVHEGGWHLVAVPHGRPVWLRPDRTPVEVRPGWAAPHEPPSAARRGVARRRDRSPARSRSNSAHGPPRAPAGLDRIDPAIRAEVERACRRTDDPALRDLRRCLGSEAA